VATTEVLGYIDQEAMAAAGLHIICSLGKRNNASSLQWMRGGVRVPNLAEGDDDRQALETSGQAAPPHTFWDQLNGGALNGLAQAIPWSESKPHTHTCSLMPQGPSKALHTQLVE
jgi:hypothetical protein